MPADPWSALTWDDLTEWAGTRSVERGKTYRNTKKVSKLARTADGGLLADVRGTFGYVAHATLKNGVLHSECTCPVGQQCKHAVAVILTYLDALKAKTAVPAASENDPRWAKLANSEDEYDEEENDEESGDDEEDEGEVAREAMARIGSRGGVARSADAKRAKAAPAKAPAKTKAAKAGKPPTVDQYLAARSEVELRELLARFARDVPAVRDALREKAVLNTGDAALLVKQARAELRKQTRRNADHGDWEYRGGGSPNYEPLRRLFEKLLALEAFDDLVALGRELFEDGTRQIEMSDDEGELHGEIQHCLAVAWQALARSARPAAEKFVLLEDLAAADEFDLLEYPEELAEAELSSAEWSSVADALLATVPATPTDAEYRRYRRERRVDAVVNALDHAGREAEATALCEREASLTGSYVRLVDRLLAATRVADAERWIAAGVAATQSKFPGIAKQLLDLNRDLAAARKDYPAVAAHAAEEFFEWPSVAKFDALLTAAVAAKCEPAVRAGAMRFLETGERPRPVLTKKSAAKNADEWPLPPAPVADTRRPHHDPAPHYSVRIDLALRDGKPAEALAWYDKWVGTKRYSASNGYAETIAAAVREVAPERSLAIYRAKALAQIESSHYDAAKAPLRHVRDLFTQLGKPAEWAAFEAELREKYRRRRNLMPVLDSLAGKSKKLIDG